jgi:hypothetical protein
MTARIAGNVRFPPFAFVEEGGDDSDEFPRWLARAAVLEVQSTEARQVHRDNLVRDRQRVQYRPHICALASEAMQQQRSKRKQSSEQLMSRSGRTEPTLPT